MALNAGQVAFGLLYVADMSAPLGSWAEDEDEPQIGLPRGPGGTPERGRRGILGNRRTNSRRFRVSPEAPCRGGRELSPRGEQAARPPPLLPQG